MRSKDRFLLKMGKADVSHKSQTYKLQNLHTYLYIEEAQNESLTCIAVNNTNIKDYNQLILSDLGGGHGSRRIVLADSNLDNNIQTYRSLHKDFVRYASLR